MPCNKMRENPCRGKTALSLTCCVMLCWSLLSVILQEEKDPAKLPALQKKWGRRHHGRTVLALSALAVMLTAVVRGSS